MAASVLAHPLVAAEIWRAWFEAGRQPIRRGFDLPEITVEGQARPLIWSERPLGPFATLSLAERADLSFERQALLIPPLSGAFAFILRDMVAALAASMRVAIVEWSNAHHVPGAAGPFLVDDQIALIAQAIRRMEPKPHLIALCQGGAPSLAAAALEASCGPERAPVSISLIAAPIRARAAVSAFSPRFVTGARAMMEAAAIWRETAHGDLRRVFPAEAQFPSLVATLAAQRPDRDEFSALILESVERSAPRPRFLDLVAAYMDQPAEFVSDNLTRLYLTPSRPCAASHFRGATVDLGALAGTPILAVEGEQDAVCAPGQTRAALPHAPARAGTAREAVLVEDTGHFGLFYGDTWRRTVFPQIAALMRAAERPGAVCA